MIARTAVLCCAAVLGVGGAVGLAACGSSTPRGTNTGSQGAGGSVTERAVTRDFRQFIDAGYARDIATTCHLSFPRGDKLLTAASLRRIHDVARMQRKWAAACKKSRFLIAPKGAKRPDKIAIRGLMIRGDLATAHVSGQIATVQTPGKPEQPTQFLRLNGRWLTTLPVPVPG